MASPVTIDIQPIKQGKISVCLLGVAPLYHHAMAEKAWRVLLLGGTKKNAAEKAATIKHVPIDEYRNSCYVTDESETRIAMPAPAFKGVLRTAALDTPGTKRTEIGRLCWVEGIAVGIYGIPELAMSIVRSADMARTPDVRTRAVMREWACEITISFVEPNLSASSIVNLLSHGGSSCGIGDWRQEKGSGSYGRFQIVNADHPDFVRVKAQGGRAAQIEALENPGFYDAQSEEMFAWHEGEVAKKGRK